MVTSPLWDPPTWIPPPTDDEKGGPGLSRSATQCWQVETPDKPRESRQPTLMCRFPWKWLVSRVFLGSFLERLHALVVFCHCLVIACAILISFWMNFSGAISMRIPCGKRPLKTSTIFGSMLKNVQGQIQILTSKFVFLCNMIDVWFRIPKCISKQFNCAFQHSSLMFYICFILFFKNMSWTLDPRITNFFCFLM